MSLSRAANPGPDTPRPIAAHDSVLLGAIRRAMAGAAGR
jgi:hypothetical protein